MDSKQLLELVIRPTLKKLGLHSEAAEQLVIGTIWQESRGEYIKQLGGGPALGLAQMEPATHDDIWCNYLAYKRTLANGITELASMQSLDDDMLPDANELMGNLNYAVAMCRVHYLRVKAPLPKAGDVEGMAAYWKQYYNTPLGAGKPQEFVENFPTI
ncbi:hypothetical protein AB6C63_023220 (plasmid) [Vibrio cyclitrophicus]